jgi:hypothetical protein
MTKLFDKLDSSAIESVEVDENVVKVVYCSNINKEYTFNCENVEEFLDNFSEILVECELNKDNPQFEKKSVGKFINQQIKQGVLVQSK